jgi:hypothetical protein
MLLLTFAGLAYSEKPGGPHKAPKGKLPFIDDSGLIVADSTFIRFHIEKKYGFNFDAGLSPEQKAAAWAIERMCGSIFIGLSSKRDGSTMKILPRGRRSSSRTCRCPCGQSLSDSFSASSARRCTYRASGGTLEMSKTD